MCDSITRECNEAKACTLAVLKTLIKAVEDGLVVGFKVSWEGAMTVPVVEVVMARHGRASFHAEVKT